MRVVRSLRVVLTIVAVGAAPLEENIYEWHVNMRCPGYDGALFHFIIKFPPTYPARPPTVDLCTHLPHPNVFPGKFGKRNHICLDILEVSSRCCAVVLCLF